MRSTFGQLKSGDFYGMSDAQEREARRAGLRIIETDDGGWGWTATVGEDFGFSSELEAWSDALAHICAYLP